jgi:hypothetical protein
MNIHNVETSRSTFATSARNPCNTWGARLQRVPQTLPSVVAVTAAPGPSAWSHVRREQRSGGAEQGRLPHSSPSATVPTAHVAALRRSLGRAPPKEAVRREHCRDLLTSSAPGRALGPWGAAARAATLSRSRRPGCIPTRRYAACGADASWACCAKLPCEGQRSWWRRTEEAATNGPLRGAPMP